MACAVFASSLWFTRTTVDYSATCVNCLARARGGETKILGFKLLKHLSLVAKGDDQRACGDPLPPTNPRIYEAISGHHCQHIFKRGGTGWGTHLFFCYAIACGSSPEESAFLSRIEAIEAVFRLFERVHDLPLARESLSLVDALLPADTDLKVALRMTKWDPESNAGRLSAFTTVLNLCTSGDEWGKVNAHFSKATIEGVPYVKDVVFLLKRSQDRHPEVHRAAILLLVELDSPERSPLISNALEDQDHKIVDAAIRTVVANHRLEFFGKMLRINPRPSSCSYIAYSVSDEDLRGLLALGDPVVDDLCHDAIVHNHRLQFLEPLLARINHYDSMKLHFTIRKLLDGPDALGSDGDPWERTKILDAPVPELISILRLGTAASVSDPRKWSFLEACKGLAAGHDTSHWNVLHETYLKAVSSGVAEYHASVIARAMHELDAARTESFLTAEIGEDELHRLTCAFAAMGLISSPRFLRPIEEFKKKTPDASPGNARPRDSMFNHPYYRNFMDYAVHRCHGIHLQTLERGKDGSYTIKKS